MSIHIILKLVIFAGISLFLINKLISVLGRIDDNDLAKSHFGEHGENSNMKDVTNSSVMENDFLKSNFTKENLSKYFVEEDQLVGLKSELINLALKIPTFDIGKFINSTKIAWQMIIKSTQEKNETVLKMLIDKRFFNKFKEENESDFLDVNTDIEDLIAKIIHINFFGNEVFIKIIFNKSLANFKQEWVFNKNFKNKGVEWYLSSIDKL